MASKKFNVISPDGFPITAAPFTSRKQANAFIPLWCKRYERQGYYSSPTYGRIPVAELVEYLRVEAIE